MKKLIICFFTATSALIFNSCNGGSTPDSETDPVVSVKAESVEVGKIETQISFNGKTIYLKKNIVVSPIAGYIVKANARFGESIQKDDTLFEIQTRESKALGSNNSLNTTIENIKVEAPSTGFINDVTINETGGYVTEGGNLCTIVDTKDLMIQLNVPFEYNSLIKPGKDCIIVLPDKTLIIGLVSRLLPLINETNQTQSVLVKPVNNRLLPENLNLTIQFLQESHDQAKLVSRSSLLTNETQDEFWVMKIIDDTLAVQVPVIKGLENDSISEVISPLLKKGDLVIVEGAYGLPDSSAVKIKK